MALEEKETTEHNEICEFGLPRPILCPCKSIHKWVADNKSEFVFNASYARLCSASPAAMVIMASATKLNELCAAFESQKEQALV